MRASDAVLLFLITSAGCSKAGSAGPQGGGLPPAGVQTVVLAPTEILDTTEYLGTLRSRRSITVQPQAC